VAIAATGIGSWSGAMAHPVARNSPAFSIQPSETTGRTTILVAIAMSQLPQKRTIACTGLSPILRTWEST
jgi:hypothetical protein